MKTARLKTLEPVRVTAHNRAALTERSYALASQIFLNLPAASWEKLIANPRAYKTRIYFIQLGGVDCGIAVFSYFPLDHPMRAQVLRAAVGMLPNARGENTINPIIARENLTFFLSTPFSKKYFSSVFLGPVMYHLATKVLYDAYPSCHTDGGQGQSVIDECIALFGFPRAGDHPAVVSTGLAVRFQDGEADAIRTSSSPTLQFYTGINPDFDKGNGVVLVSPHTLANVFFSTVNLLRKRKVYK